MSADLAFSTNRRPGQLLFRFLRQGHALLATESARRLRPLIDFLAEFHLSGQAHGAVTPGRLLLSPEGEWDLDFFKIRAGSPDPLELEIYYPDGPGRTLEERQQNDIKALAAVLHLIITDHPPARPQRRAASLCLTGHPLAKAWPSALTSWVDRVLETPPGDVPPSLEEISTALRPEETAEPGTVSAEDHVELTQAEDAAAREEVSTPTPDSLGIEVVEIGEPPPVEPCMPAPQAISPEPAALPVPPPPLPPQLMETFAASITTVRLPNAMAGRPFAVELSGFEELSDTPADTRFEIPENLPTGLHLSNSLLSGTPAEPGEYEFSLLMLTNSPSGPLHPSGPFSPSPAAPAQPIRLQLTINPDPRSLWKNLPSDPSSQFPKPDTGIQTLGALTPAGIWSEKSPIPQPQPPLTVLGASLRGRSHAHTGAFRDDDMAMAWHPDQGWCVLAVADGAGSARFSREGSRLACQEILAFFTEAFSAPSCSSVNVTSISSPASPNTRPTNREDSLTLLAEAHARAPEDAAPAAALHETLTRQFQAAAARARLVIEKTATVHAAELRDFHTTLITVLLHPLADGRWFAAAFSIGDGAAAVIGAPDGNPCLLTKADSGDFAGQTIFLTMDQAQSDSQALASRVKTAILPSFEAIALVTDGISDPLFPSDTTLADPAHWDHLWQKELQPLLTKNPDPQIQAAALLDWMSFHSPGHHDDRTLILAVPSPLPVLPAAN